MVKLCQRDIHLEQICGTYRTRTSACWVAMVKRLSAVRRFRYINICTLVICLGNINSLVQYSRNIAKTVKLTLAESIERGAFFAPYLLISRKQANMGRVESEKEISKTRIWC